MATIAQIRQGMADNLATLTGFQVSAYMLASPTPPAIHVLPTSISYDQAMHRGLDALEFTVQAFVAFGLDIAAQQALDEVIEDDLKTALESDRTLGGVVQDCRLSELTGIDVLSLPDRPQMLVANFRVEVYA